MLPGVMGIEAFAEAALCVHPGWHIEAVEEVNFLAPFKFYKDEPRTVTIEAIYRPLVNGLVADCRLIGKRSLPNQAGTAGDGALHRPRAANQASVPEVSRGRKPGFGRGDRSRRLRSIAFTSMGRHTRCWNAHGGMGSTDHR